MTKHLDEIYRRIVKDFGNKEFTISDAILLPRPRYNLDRLVTEKRLTKRVSEQNLIYTVYYRIIENI